MSSTIKQPETKEEFSAYYNMRWRILRAPWDEPEGSEKDDIEDECIHIIACDDNNNVIGIGRLQFNSEDEAQIRYMAVEKEHEGRGIGTLVVKALEAHAKKQNRTNMMLHAREPAVGFYEKLGYQVSGKSYLLFDSIQHYQMQKMLGSHATE